jgi:cytochrome c5
LSHNDKQFATVFVMVLAGLAILAVILYMIAGYLTEEVSAYKPEEVVLENIKPVGQVNIAGESAQAEVVAEDTAVAAEPMSGEQIYQSKCIACHAAGVAGAPKVGDAAAWKPRIAQGMDTLLKHAVNGLNAMPPKGTCANCSEDDLKAAIEFMVSQSQ